MNEQSINKLELGPKYESGVCDSCANKKDFNLKLVYRIFEDDNLYACSTLYKEFKNFVDEYDEDEEYDYE